MAKTERINLLVSPTEKSDIELRAKRAGISTSELVRKALARHDETIEFEHLVEIAEELGAAVTRMNDKLDTTLARVNELQAQTANHDQLAAEIRQELVNTEQQWPFSIRLNTGRTAGGNH